MVQFDPQTVLIVLTTPAALSQDFQKKFSDVNKDLTCKDKAKAKDLTIKAKAKANDLIYKAKAKAKDLTFKVKAKAKDLIFNAKPSTYVARQQYWSLCFLPRFISILWIVCCA